MTAAGTKPDYLDPRVLAKISRMELRARLVVEGFISGLHRSPYHGFSVEFAEHREYVPGDPIAHIDWKVWARNDRFYIKQYEEETNLRCTLMLDCSKSMAYGAHAGGMSKFDYGATVAASLAYLLQQQQDAAGLVLFDGGIRLSLPPSSKQRGLRLMLHELEKAEPDSRSDVSSVFLQLAAQAKRRGIVAIVSDLFFGLEDLEKGLRQLRHNRHEVVLFHVLHGDELSFPFRDNTLFRGLEEQTELLAEPPALRRSYLEALDRFLKSVRRVCSQSSIDYVLLNTGDRLDAALSRYLASRDRLRHTYGKG